MFNFRSTAAAALAIAAATAAHAENFTLRVGAGHPSTLAYVQPWEEYFSEQLRERAAELGHNVRVIGAYGTVAGVDNVIETTASGAFDIGLAIPIFEPGNLELFNFGNMMPFASPDPILSTEVANRMIEETPALQTYLDDFGLEILGMNANENYGMSLRTAPESLDDVAGMRIASGAVNAPWTAAVGGIPTPIPVNENYQAMQSGLLDGNIYFISGMEVFQFSEVIDAYYQTDFGSLPGILAVMNRETREEMPEELVALIDEIAEETLLEAARIAAERDAEFTERASENVTVVQITEEDKAEWAERLRPGIEEAVAEMDGRGLPASEVFGTWVRYLREAGHEFPVTYSFE